MSEVVAEKVTTEEGPPEEVSSGPKTIALQLRMREEILLRLLPRDEQGKGPVGRLRREMGMLPGVLYGHQQEPLSFKVEALLLERLLSKGGQNATFMVEIEGAEQEVWRAVVREIQYHKVRGDILHVDLLRIDPQEKLRVSVPLIAQGIPAGVRAGGALQQSLADIEVECVASELPSGIEINVSPLEVGDSVHVRDLLEQENRILTDPERTVCTVLAPRLIEEAAEGEEVVEGEEAAEGGEAAEGEEAAEDGAAEGGAEK